MTVDELMDKMRSDVERFNTLVQERQYVRAINLYNLVHAVAYYVELPDEYKLELFGDYYLENEDSVPIEGAFRKDKLLRVADDALKEEAAENRRGRPAQIRDFRHYAMRPPDTRTEDIINHT